MNHEIVEKRAWLLGTLIAVVISVGGRWRSFRCICRHRHLAGPGHQALCPLELAARRLRPRRLLPLPQQMVRRCRPSRALRPLLHGRRDRLRPSFPVRIEAHGTDPPGWAADTRRVAPRAFEQSPRRRAGIEHARFVWRPRPPWTLNLVAAKMRVLRHRRAYTMRTFIRRRRVAGHTELDALISYLQGSVPRRAAP